MVTEFQKKVYDLCSKVPAGRITTYREIGKALGGKGQIYRAVGVALNKNPFGFLGGGNVPCHRVVCSGGKVGGFAYGVQKKIRMLEDEGIKIKCFKVLNFEGILWVF